MHATNLPVKLSFDKNLLSFEKNPCVFKTNSRAFVGKAEAWTHMSRPGLQQIDEDNGSKCILSKFVSKKDTIASFVEEVHCPLCTNRKHMEMYTLNSPIILSFGQFGVEFSILVEFFFVEF